MSVAFHPPETLLLAYSAGRCDEATALVVATHLTLCPTCRADDARLDAVGGALLEQTPNQSVPENLFERLLARLEAPLAEPSPALRSHPIVPRPLLAYLDLPADSDALPWKRLMPGAEEIRLPLQRNGIPARMTRTRGGFVLPKHTHEGTELTLVLSGGFQDRGEHYERGDLSVCDAAVTHAIHFDKGEPCIALVVNEARLVPKGAVSKTLALFIDF